MTGSARLGGPPGEVPLVPGELRGYRQFLLLEDGLFPVVHVAQGPWTGRHVAVCAVGGEHEPPARGCTCGLYGWYHPVSAAVAYGTAHAVIAVSGRVVLGDLGFRAARGRVEAVTLPWALRLRPGGRSRVTARMRVDHPAVTIYRSRRRMLRDHPPQDVGALGVGPPDRTRSRCRRAAFALWALFVMAGYAVLLLPQARVAGVAATWWPLLLAAFVAWQAALVTLAVRGQPRERTRPRPATGGEEPVSRGPFG